PPRGAGRGAPPCPGRSEPPGSARRRTGSGPRGGGRAWRSPRIAWGAPYSRRDRRLPLKSPVSRRLSQKSGRFGLWVMSGSVRRLSVPDLLERLDAAKTNGMADAEAADLAVFEAHRPRLVALAYRMLGDIGRAEDMVQEGWLRWRSREDEARSPRAYL